MKKQKALTLTEQYVVAKALYDPNFLISVYTWLTPSDFVDKNSRAIYSAILNLTQKGAAVDRLAILEMDPNLEMPNISDASEPVDYIGAARRIHENGKTLRIKTLMADFLDRADKEGDKFDFEKAFKQFQSGLAQDDGSGLDMLVGGEIIDRYNDHLVEVNAGNQSVGKFGIRRLDQITQGGLKRGRLTAIVAAPGTGKTMLGVQIFEESQEVSENPVVYISNEMTAEQLTARIVNRNLAEPLEIEKTYSGVFEGKSYADYEATASRLQEIYGKTKPIIAAKNTHKLENIERIIRYCAITHGAGMFVIDHLHNLQADKGQSLYEKISDAAHVFQRLAQQLNIHIAFLCQMSNESKKSATASAVGAKGAGDVEEVVNMLIVLKRDRVDEGDDTNINLLDIVVTKNRDGATGLVPAEVKFPSMKIEQYVEF